MQTVAKRVFLVAAIGLAGSVAIGALGPPTPDAAAVQIQYGSLLFDQGRYREAMQAFHRASAVADRPLQKQARAGVVRASLRIAEFRMASEAASMLHRTWPDDPDVLGLYADSRWAMGLFDEAEATIDRLLATWPSHARGRHGRARVLAARNRLDDALAEARAAVAASPGDAELHHTLGFIYERMRRFDEAAGALTNCLNLLPDRDVSDQAAWARAEVRFLRSFGSRRPYDMTPAVEQQQHTVPFRLERDKIVVRARVNGRRDPVEFVVDTGAESTVVSRPMAQRYGIAPMVTTLSAGVGEVGFRTLQLGKLDSLEIGTLKVRNLPVIIKSPALQELPTREQEAFSPLSLGLSMTVDYDRRLLTMGPGATIGEADVELPLWLHRLATVRGIVDDSHSATFIVDTGGEVISISTATAQLLTKLRESRRIQLKVYGTSGWDRDAYLLPGVDLAFDQIEFRNLPVVVLNLGAPSALLGYQIGGIVGHRFLSKYRFEIDLNRSVLRLKRTT